ncbi:MAG: hypothetical protein KF796_17335 [Ramlibacter sp.]|nr:hypothetical protein [Ramlibacter sp.]
MTSARKFKLQLKAPRPRNPLVAAARTRKAGEHRKSEKARRAADKVRLRKDIGP